MSRSFSLQCFSLSIILASGITACGDSPGAPEQPTPKVPVPAAVAPTTPLSLTGVVADSVTVAVRVTDAGNQGVANAVVRFEVIEGAGTAKSPQVTTDSHGDAQAAWILSTVPGSNRLRASVLQLTPVEFVATTQPGAAATLSVQAQPGGAKIGSVLESLPVIELRDRFGNAATAPAVTVTVSIASGGGALTGTTTVSSRDGVARFEDIQISGPVGPRTLRFEAPALGSINSSPFTVMPAARSAIDRPDDLPGPQIHFVYAVPSDAPDRSFDTALGLAYSVMSFQSWLALKTGYRLRVDTYRGAADVTFLKLDKTDQQIAAAGPFVRDTIERFMRVTGQLAADKIYAVYYDGTSTYACGGASWPPLLIGQLAAMYMRGLPQSASPCSSAVFVNASTEFPRYWEFAMLHDLLHTLGIVSREAPHHVASRPAHVGEPRDLMYAGDAPWQLGTVTTVDVDEDDYFGQSVAPGLANLAGSPYVERVSPAFNVFSELTPLSAEAVRKLAHDAVTLPVHPDFGVLIRNR